MDDLDDFDDAALAQIDQLEKNYVASQGSSQGGGLADRLPAENRHPQQAAAPLSFASHAMASLPTPAPPSRPAVAPSPSITAREYTDDLLPPLSHFFGFDAFRTGQEEAVRGVLSGRDVCVYWPTGQGKSVCYQLPALVSNKVVVVVSPLVSLMVDQCAKLNNTVGSLPQFAHNPPAIFLGPHQKDHAGEERALKGQGARVIYCSPEKLMMSNLLSRLSAMHRDGLLLMIAIDEVIDSHIEPADRARPCLDGPCNPPMAAALAQAHCVSAWGHDFRSEYQQLGVLRERLPSVPLLALTATAVPAVQADLQKSLGMRAPTVLRQSAFRDNLAITCGAPAPNTSLESQPSLFIRGPTTPRFTLMLHVRLTSSCAAACANSAGLPPTSSPSSASYRWAASWARGLCLAGRCPSLDSRPLTAVPSPPSHHRHRITAIPSPDIPSPAIASPPSLHSHRFTAIASPPSLRQSSPSKSLPLASLWQVDDRLLSHGGTLPAGPRAPEAAVPGHAGRVVPRLVATQ